MKIVSKLSVLLFTAAVSAIFSSTALAQQQNLYLIPKTAAPASKDMGEKQKIFYLISRVEKSPYTFVRNGEEHTGKEAAKHLRWKYGKAFDRVKTAEQFIEYIASRSLLTGQMYMLKFSDGSMHPVREVLYNELGMDEEK